MKKKIPTTFTPPPNLTRDKKGLIIVNTGNGKGKTTAGFGVILRAWGRDMKTLVVQFIKNEKSMYGEQLAVLKLDIELITSGRGFTWTSKDLSEDEDLAQKGWNISKEKILSGDYDVILLDEITYPINYGWIDINDVLDTLKKKPEMLHVILTGRDADKRIQDFINYRNQNNFDEDFQSSQSSRLEL